MTLDLALYEMELVATLYLFVDKENDRPLVYRCSPTTTA